MKYNKAQVEEARGYLMECVKPGDKLYTILRQVSRSGMSRHISVVIMEKDGMREITHLVARFLGDRRDEHDGGLVVSGCGMDMGFEIVYRLGYALFPNGFGVLADSVYPIKPQTKQEAEQLVKQGVKFHGRNGDTSGWDNDGGYALKQEWL